TPVGVVDILPTICEIVELKPSTNQVIDGVSLLPLFIQDTIVRSKPLYWFYSPSRPFVSIREGNWALVADPEVEISQNNLFQEDWIGLIKNSGLKNFRLFNLRKNPRQIVFNEGHLNMNKY